jgi:hypothetical protein
MILASQADKLASNILSRDVVMRYLQSLLELCQ